jgi:hypothetical protein
MNKTSGNPGNSGAGRSVFDPSNEPEKNLTTVGILRHNAKNSASASLKMARFRQSDLPGTSDQLGVEWTILSIPTELSQTETKTR